MATTETQEALILKRLQKGKGIKQLQALIKFNCLRLSGRIHDLRRRGYNIETKMVEKNGKRYGEYFMPEYEKKSIWDIFK